MDPNKNGQELAFPFVETREMQGESISFGLTKREHFAAMAMHGLASKRERFENVDEFARCVVEHADALLRALAAWGEG